MYCIYIQYFKGLVSKVIPCLDAHDITRPWQTQYPVILIRIKRLNDINNILFTRRDIEYNTILCPLCDRRNISGNNVIIREHYMHVLSA